MMAIYLSFIVACAVMILNRASEKDPVDGFRKMLHHTQNCNNTNLLYFTHEMARYHPSLVAKGYKFFFSGLGNEFHRFFVQALKEAVVMNKRLIYVTMGYHWENDCDGNLTITSETYTY